MSNTVTITVKYTPNIKHEIHGDISEMPLEQIKQNLIPVQTSTNEVAYKVFEIPKIKAYPKCVVLRNGCFKKVLSENHKVRLELYTIINTMKNITSNISFFIFDEELDLEYIEKSEAAYYFNWLFSTNKEEEIVLLKKQGYTLLNIFEMMHGYDEDRGMKFINPYSFTDIDEILFSERDKARLLDIVYDVLYRDKYSTSIWVDTGVIQFPNKEYWR